MAEEKLNIGILGPGAIGSLIACLSFKAGDDVVMIGREESIDAITKNGVVLESKTFGTIHAQTKAETKLSSDVDVLFITVKSPFLEDALKRIPREHIRQSIVVPLLNGIGHVEKIRHLESPVVVGTIGSVEVSIVSPGVVRQFTSLTPHIDIASDKGVSREKLVRVADFLTKIGIETSIRASEAEVIWSKLVRLNAIASVTALYNKPLGEIRSRVESLNLVQSLVEEGAVVAGRDGVTIDPVVVMKDIQKLPDDLTTSLQRDIASGAESELETITGGVLAKAKMLGVSCSHLEETYKQLRQMARSGITSV